MRVDFVVVRLASLGQEYWRLTAREELRASGRLSTGRNRPGGERQGEGKRGGDCADEAASIGPQPSAWILGPGCLQPTYYGSRLGYPAKALDPQNAGNGACARTMANASAVATGEKQLPRLHQAQAPAKAIP